ncbi:hypothetical protein BAC7755_03080 [Bacillus sp. MN7755]
MWNICEDFNKFVARGDINDFSDISIITSNISTIFSIYRRVDKGYRLINK